MRMVFTYSSFWRLLLSRVSFGRLVDDVVNEFTRRFQCLVCCRAAWKHNRVVHILEVCLELGLVVLKCAGKETKLLHVTDGLLAKCLGPYGYVEVAALLNCLSSAEEASLLYPKSQMDAEVALD